MNLKKHIPNLITLLNLLCGCIALVFAGEANFEMAFFFVCLGIFFDFIDGFFARLFHVSSQLGLQLDSLADMVTSGVVPGLVLFKMLSNSVNSDPSLMYLPYLGFIITLGSCYRLANFNIDTRQTDSFIGLPTPANALLIMSIPMIQFHSEFEWLVDFLSNPFVLVGVTVLSSYLLNAEIPLFSLKVKSFSWEKYKMQVVFMIISVILIAIFEFIAIPIIILLYVILSVVNNTILKKV